MCGTSVGSWLLESLGLSVLWVKDSGAELFPCVVRSDNILYYSYVAFETYKDLAEHLKQDATKKFIKCAAAYGLHHSKIF